MDIIIWGCGKIGKYVFDCLKEYPNENNVIDVVDSDLSKVGKKFENINIKSVEELNRYVDSDVAVLVAFDNCKYVHNKLVEMGIRNFGFVVDSVWLEKKKIGHDILNDSNIIWKNGRKPYLNTIEFQVVDWCNLNCKGCSHFSSLFEKNIYIEKEELYRDLEKISKYIEVGLINILGGEPLLHPEISEIVCKTRELFDHSDIVIVTNGLILPDMPREFFEICREANIEFSISGYAPTLRIKEQIEQKLIAYKVKYYMKTGKETFGKNIDLRGENDKVSAMQYCRERFCHHLRNGKIYKCAFEALGNTFFESFDYCNRVDGGISISDGNDWAEIISKLDYEPCDACKYCGKEERFEWKTTNKPTKYDWLVNDFSEEYQS